MAGHVVVSTYLYRTPDADGNPRRYRRGDVITDLSQAEIRQYEAAEGIVAASSERGKAVRDTPDPTRPAATVHPSAEPAEDDFVESRARSGSVATPASEIQTERTSGVRPQKPAKAATAEAWREYAVQSGEFTEEEAKALTRDELRDRLL